MYGTEVTDRRSRAGYLARVFSPGGILVTTERIIRVFAGANLFQSGFTRFCPLEMILKRCGVRCEAHA